MSKFLETLMAVGVYVIGVSAIGLILFWPQISVADELAHKFKSPSFSGISTSAHYLTIENQEKSRRDSIAKEIESALLAAKRELENTTMAKFMRNLESRIYSQLSKQLVEQLFKQCDLLANPACVQANFGSFALEGNTISYLRTTCDTASMTGCVIGEDVIILTVVADDGTETIITIPIGNGTFGGG